jgi:emfourin
MRIRVERTGGLAGIQVSNEIDADGLPSGLLQTARKIMEDKKPFSLKSAPKGSADHYIYKISVLDGDSQTVIECNQYNIKDDLKSLIRYIERYSNKP